MNKLILFLLIITCFTSCKTKTGNIPLSENISITIPSDYSVTEEGSTKTFEAIIDNDKIKVFIVRINSHDTLNSSTQKQYFINNINSFIETFNFSDLDTTITFDGKYFQGDIKFDYINHDKQNRFYGRFFAEKKDFIAICYHMTNTDNNNFKNKLFNSLKIK